MCHSSDSRARHGTSTNVLATRESQNNILLATEQGHCRRMGLTSVGYSNTTYTSMYRRPWKGI